MRNARIESIDILRGFALLGILIMNVSSFAMPSMAYFSPVVYAVNNMNHIVYSFTHIIADQKFMAIFSMLFGASTLLFINSSKKFPSEKRAFFWKTDKLFNLIQNAKCTLKCYTFNVQHSFTQQSTFSLECHHSSNLMTNKK